MERTFVWTGSLLAGTGVVLGALGAHYLKQNLSVTSLQSFETGVRYQLYHAMAILFLSVLPLKLSGRYCKWAFYAFLFGTLFFSGSIYLLSTAALTGINLPWLGPVTPVGGLLFITGWIILFAASLRSMKEI